MIELLEYVLESLPANKLFEISTYTAQDPYDEYPEKMAAALLLDICLVDEDDMVYGVCGKKYDGQEATAQFTTGESFWLLDEPRHATEFKDTGLSPVLDMSLTLKVRENDRYEMGWGKFAGTKPGKWMSIESSKSQFIEQINVHKEGKKDGTCFTQGSLLDGKRSSKSVVANYVMVFDIDVGLTEKEITEKLEEYGYEFILYSTHSHLKTTSDINRDAFFKWSKEDSSKNVKVSSLKNYLCTVKKYRLRVVETLKILKDAEPSSNGVTIIVKHNEMPKFRIVFFLNEPFIFQGKYSQKERIIEWKERYYGLARQLELPVDKSCVDPGRLFYFPRHEKGSKNSTIYMGGEPLVLEDIERISLRDLDKVEENAFTKAAGNVQDHDEYTYNGESLLTWAAKYADIFDIHTALEDTGYTEFRDERSSKEGIHIQCPYEDGHSEPGGNGTYVLNASDNEEDTGFVVHCMHDSCTGRDRLDYLIGFLEEGTLTLEDLQNADFLCEEVVEEDTEPVKKYSRKWFEVKVEEMDIETTNQRTMVKNLMEVPDKEISEGIKNQMVEKIAKKTGINVTKLKKFAENSEKKETKKKKKNSKESLYTTDAVRDIVDDLNDYLIFGCGSAKVLRKTFDIEGGAKFDEKSHYDMKNILANQHSIISYGGETKEHKWFDLWMDSPDRNTCEGLTFQPRKPERILKAGGTVWVNTYSEFTRWDNDDPEASWDLMKFHILDILCDGDEKIYNRFILFFANIVQNPDKKYAQTIIIKGGIGCGKSIVTNFFIEMIGRAAKEVNDSKSLTSKFNDHLAEKLLIVLDEGDFKASMSKIKNIISSKVLEVEPKGAAKRWVNNCIRIMVPTNEESTITVSLDSERRFFVLQCSNKWVQPPNAPKSDQDRKAEYFMALASQMEEQGGIDQMFYDLKHWDPAEYGLSFERDLMVAPYTDALREESVTSVPKEIEILANFVLNGYFSEVPQHDLDEVILNEEGETYIPRKLFHKHVYYMLDRAKVQSVAFTPQAIRGLVDRVLKGTIGLVKPSYAGMAAHEGKEPVHCFRLLPKAEMVAHMVKKGYVNDDK